MAGVQSSVRLLPLWTKRKGPERDCFCAVYALNTLPRLVSVLTVKYASSLTWG
jgi:hypothetical protein